MTLERFEEVMTSCFNIKPNDCSDDYNNLDILRATNFVNARIGNSCECECSCNDDECNASAREKATVYYVLMTQAYDPQEELGKIEHEVLSYMNNLGIYGY